jgi:hypothetical protein
LLGHLLISANEIGGFWGAETRQALTRIQIIGYFGPVQPGKTTGGLAGQKPVRKWCKRFAPFLQFTDPKADLVIVA